MERVVVVYEAGRDGCWLARWLRMHDIEAYVVVASREHRRAKTDRLDPELLLRAPHSPCPDRIVWRNSRAASLAQSLSRGFEAESAQVNGVAGQ